MRVDLYGLFQFPLLNELVLSVSVQNRSGTKQQRPTPIGEIGNVSREANDALLDSRDRFQTHGFVLRQILNFGASRDRGFNKLSYRCGAAHQTNSQVGKSRVRDNIGSRAAANYTDVTSGLA